jgi:hypothetical protein
MVARRCVMDGFTTLVIGGFIGLLLGMTLMRPRRPEVVVVRNDPDVWERRSACGCFVPFVLVLALVTVLLVAMG